MMNQINLIRHRHVTWLCRAFFGLSLCFTLSAALAAEDPQFASPLACTVGLDCFIQNYVDTGAAAGVTDFSCGTLTYDGHKGTDIRLPNYVAMERGVVILAAAAGTVLRVRDGMSDVSVRDIGIDAVKDRMAGNSVIIDHGDGWVTQYGHMKKGSIAVRPGQHVAVADKLGQVGLSGNTEFPHLHFEVRHDEHPIDPFTGKDMEDGCGRTGYTLWQADVAQSLAYRPTGLLGSGYSIGVPESEAARHGAYAGVAPTRDSMVLTFWVDLYGLQKGDRFSQVLTGPGGTVLARVEAAAPKAKAQYFSFVGKKRPDGGWPSGLYRASFRLTHDTEVVIQDVAEIWISARSKEGALLPTLQTLRKSDARPARPLTGSPQPSVASR